MPSPTGTVERRLVPAHPSGGAHDRRHHRRAWSWPERVFVAAHRPLSWAAAAVVAAVLLDPIVDRLAVHIRRVPAVLITFAGHRRASAWAPTYLVFDEVEQALDRLEAEAPDAAETIEDRDDRVGELARDFELTDRIRDGVGALDERVTGGDDVLRSTAGTAPAYFVCAILTVFLMTYRPAHGRTPPCEQERDLVRRRSHRGHRRPGGAPRPSRRCVFAIAEAPVGRLGGGGGRDRCSTCPRRPRVGFTAGVLSLFPYVGLTLGSIPLLLLTLGFRSLFAAAVLLVVVLVVQLVDSFLLRPRMAQQSVEVGLVVPWVVALLGYTIYGIGGAVYGTHRTPSSASPSSTSSRRANRAARRLAL